MPRILLQHHLMLLYEELIKRIPERHESYTGLRDAAKRLAAERRQLMSDADFDRLSHEFQLMVGVDWSQRLANSGRILTSAEIDERAGIPDALASVTGWFRDNARFPRVWIGAVDACVTEAVSIIAADTPVDRDTPNEYL
jgi:hypothetical protein